MEHAKAVVKDADIHVREIVKMPVQAADILVLEVVKIQVGNFA